MTDNKIGPIVRPIQEGRSPEKAAPKEPLKGLDFSTTLKQVLNDSVQPKGAAPASTNTQAILDGAAAQAKQMDTMRRIEQALREEYANVTRKAPQPDQD